MQKTGWLPLLKGLADSIEAGQNSLATAGHKGVFLLDPFTYQDHHGTATSIGSGSVAGLFKELKIWALEKLEEISAVSKQKLYESIEQRKMAPKQSALDLTSEKIPKLDPIYPGTDNNLAQWLFIIDKRWKLWVKYNQSSMSAFTNTVKENSGPLKTSLMNKTTYHEVWTTIKIKY